MKKNKHFRLLLLLIVLLWVGEVVNKKQRTSSPSSPKTPPKTCFPSKCYSVDLIFVLDENVDGADWQRTKNFVGELVKLLPIDRRFFHLGLVKYSGRKFHLTPDPWGDKNGGLAVKLSDLGFSKANFTSSLAQATSVRTEKTSIGTGLEMARRMFLESRYGERQFIVLVGANNQERGEDLKMVVSKLKNDTVIFPLAFGSQIDNTTLTTIATIPNRFWWFSNSTQLQTATTALLDAFLHRCPFVRPERCVDSDPCTQDICDPNSGRCHYVKGNCRVGSLSLTKSNPTPKTNTSGCTNNNQCEDGNHCTTNICVNGRCATSFNSLPCQSADKCSAGDVCHLGKCAPGNRSKCDDGNPCTDNTCDPVTGQCSFKYNTKPCNDEDRCTVDDRCHRGVCRGKPKSCDDGNGCTFDFCNPTNGNCSHRSLDQQSCDDGGACTMDDFCERGVCKGRSKKICTDRNPCTTDRCNSKTGSCEFSAVQDGNRCSFSLCSLDNFCLHGFCQGGREKDCDDHNSTTVDLCEPKTGRCRHLLPHNLPTEAPALPLSRAGVKGLTVPPIRLSGQAANTTTNSTSKTTTENQDSATNNLALIIIGSIVGATLVVAVILALYVVHKRKQEENGAGGKGGGGLGGGNQLRFQPLQEVVAPPPSSSPLSSTPTPTPSPSPLLDPSPTTTTPAPAPVVVAAALTPTQTETQPETPTEEDQVKPVTQQIDSDIQQIKEKIFQLQSLHQQLQLNPMSLSQPTTDFNTTTTDATDATNTTTTAVIPAGMALATATTQQDTQPPQSPQPQAQPSGPNELVFRTPSEAEMSEISKIDRLISDLPSFTPYEEPSFTPSNFEFDEPSSLIAPSPIPAPTTTPSVPTFISPPTNFELPPPTFDLPPPTNFDLPPPTNTTHFDLPPPAGPTDLT